MNNVLESFVSLDDNLIQHLYVKNSMIASYLNDNNRVKLKLEKINNELEEYYLSSLDDNYNLAKNNLCIHGCVNIQNIKSLYGKDNDFPRIALDDTVIGIALNGYSLVSKHNFTKSIGEITLNDDNSSSVIYNIDFPTGALADKLFLSINLYVKEAKTNSNIYATIDGTVIGTIYSAIINLEGTGSIFPIRIVSEKEEPLWYIDLNYNDLNDAFCQNNICLNINSSHNDFDKIGSQDITLDNKAMWKEILAAFFSQTLVSLSDGEKNDIYKENIYNDGSIGLFLQYILENFDIDKPILDNPILLNKKILLGLDNIMK